MNRHEWWLIFWYHRSSAFRVFFLSIIVATILAIGVARKYQATGKIQLAVNNQIQDNLEDNIYFFNSYSAINQVIEDLRLVDEQGNLLDYHQFIVNLNVNQDTDSRFLTLTYTSKDIEKSKLVVNYLIKSYINHQLVTKQNKFIEIENTLRKQLNLAEVQLQETQAELKSFLEKYDHNILQARLEANFASSITIEEKIINAETKIKEIHEKITALKLQLSFTQPLVAEDNHHLVSYESEPIITYLEPNKEQVASTNHRFNSNNPKIIDWNLANIPPKKEIHQKSQENSSSFLSSKNYNSSELTKNLISEESDKNIGLTQVETWDNPQKNHNNLSLSVKTHYQNLIYKTKIAETNCNTLAKTIEQFQVSKKQEFAYPVQINSVTLKNNLVSWNKEIIIVSGIAIGSLLSFATVFILEKKNTALKTPTSICELFNTQLLAIIPNFKPLNLGKLNSFQEILPERLVLEAPYSLASEAYELVYNNLQSNQSNVKLITIASPIAQEGKSTLCANFATLTARLGKKVLLIDANFYQPRQHEIWGLSNIFGLTNFLKSNAKFEDIVKSPSLNLDVITTGFILGDGLSLLQSETMPELINRVKEKYDLIIFDTPSINLYPNALTINKFTDGLLLVGRTGVTDVQSIMRTKELIEKSQQRVLGIVINDKNANF